MQKYQEMFVQTCLDFNVLNVDGGFSLKGRKSPYLINMSAIPNVEALFVIGRCYAAAFLLGDTPNNDNLEEAFPILLGPPDTGEILAFATATVLSQEYAVKDVRFSSFRKEGSFSGNKERFLWAPLEIGSHVVIVTGVISSGTTIGMTIDVARERGAYVRGVIAGFDREDRGTSGFSVAKELSEQKGVFVQSIVGMRELMEYIREDPKYKLFLPRFEAYWKEYGAKEI